MQLVKMIWFIKVEVDEENYQRSLNGSDNNPICFSFSNAILWLSQ